MISVIIPIYNSSKLLRKCIDSVIKQSYKNTEIILIDDGSTDDSIKICNEYVANYSNIVLYLNEKNMGIYTTRIRAIGLAKGDYITFVDSDDWLNKNSLYVLHETAIIHNADIVQMRHKIVYPKFKVSITAKKHTCFNSTSIKAPELQNRCIQSFLGDENIIPVFPWGKLYSATLLKSISFPVLPHVWGDDQIINLIIFHHAKTFATTQYIGYNYRWGGFSNIPQIGEIDKYDNFLIEISKVALMLGYEKHLELLKEQNQRFFRFYIRHCIATFHLPKDEIIDIITLREIDKSKAINIYLEEKRNTQKYFYKNIIRRIIS